ncbi:hypothetical protein GTCCBUS3UF5_11650 [Geobacillus thermoleovorans CCB_US3_UF5]|uniref:Uncharacterized protein n=1 Tax=Geobacillus thermoleovorans CCB_US3_UF5 TaxID=1111068 RepID=A0ABM5MFK5_GEOTH|nr:hypothetical protein GTCCBUS3UF5_11650 [Geobacillus thermoleovorans CCB_US3_UF5]
MMDGPLKRTAAGIEACLIPSPLPGRRGLGAFLLVCLIFMRK